MRIIWDEERRYLYLAGHNQYVGVYLPKGFRFWKKESVTGNIYFENENERRISISLSSKGLVIGVPEGSVAFIQGGLLDIFEEREIGVEFSDSKVEVNSSVGNIVVILEDAPSPYGFVEDEGFEEYEDVYEEEEE